jgi:hypothetical protein
VHGARGPSPPPLEKRYVAQDGITLTDDVGQAKALFVPAIVLEAHTPVTVQLLPPNVDSLEQAEGVILWKRCASSC